MFNHKSTTKNFAIVLLAAGQSSRLGQMKQLLPIQNKKLITVQLEMALKVTDKVYCVLGYQAKEIHDHIDHLPITTIINSTWSEGMASSIARGVDALAPDTQAVMIILVDQWQLTSADLTRHLAYWQEAPDAIVVAQNESVMTENAKEKIGPPVIFPQHYFAELKQLTGQQGAKPLLKKYQDKLLKVALGHAFIDLDTPEQLTQMNKILGVKP